MHIGCVLERVGAQGGRNTRAPVIALVDREAQVLRDEEKAVGEL